MADPTATYISHYMIACVLLVVAPFLESPWLLLIFAAEAVVHVCVAYVVQNSDASLIHYLHGSSPRARLCAMWFLNAANVARWCLAAKLLFGWASPTYYVFTGFNALLNGVFLLYTLVATVRSRFEPRAKYAFRSLFLSLLVLGFGFVFAYAQRNMNHFHIRNDPRLLYSGITQWVYALLIFPLSRFVPEWAAAFLTLPLWMVLWVCAGHERILGIF